MRVTRIGEQKSCSFCKKSQQTAQRLIASPDQSTYICDECTVDPSRLKPTAEEREAQREAPSSSFSRVSRFLQKHLHTNRLRCSFCRKRLRSINSDLPPRGRESQVQICKDCLAVCQQILRNEVEKSSSSS